MALNSLPICWLIMGTIFGWAIMSDPLLRAKRLQSLFSHHADRIDRGPSNPSMFVEPERRKSRKFKPLHLQVSATTQGNRILLAVLFVPITFRSRANALIACSALAQDIERNEVGSGNSCTTCQT